MVSPPKLHPHQRQARRSGVEDSFTSNGSMSGARMSPAGRQHKFADGRQSRGSGSSSRARRESELHAVSVIKKKDDDTPKRTNFKQGARDQSLELKMKRMAEDAARAQEA